MVTMKFTIALGALAALLCLAPVDQATAGFFGIDRRELLVKLNGASLEPDQVLRVLNEAKDGEAKVIGQISVKDLIKLNELDALSRCTKRELDQTNEICQTVSEIGNVQVYCSDRFKKLVQQCNQNIMRLFRRGIVEIGTANKQHLLIFMVGVVRNLDKPDNTKTESIQESIDKYLANTEYISEDFRDQIGESCLSVTQNLELIEVIEKLADEPLPWMNDSLSEWYTIYKYCKVFNQMMDKHE